METLATLEHAVAVVGGVVTVASAIVKASPEQPKSSTFSKILNVLNFLALNKIIK